MAPRVAIVHDYLTQRGGAERVVLLLAEAFPGAPVHTSLYDPAGTFPEFGDVNVQPLPLNRLPFLRHHHRWALPVLAPAFSAHRVEADVVLCSSSGWAHGVRATGHKVVYCYAPARWLYQTDRYLGRGADISGRRHGAGTAATEPLGDRLRGGLTTAGLRALSPPLRRWDRRAAASADRYLTSSSTMAAAITAAYGIEAEILPPPPALTPGEPVSDPGGLAPGFFLCIARLLPYKNVDVVVDAMHRLPDRRLVVVGDGEIRGQLEAAAPPNVTFVGRVDDRRLRWLYANCRALVAASYEDYGLTPLEAAAFARPSAVLRAGGFLDTLVEGKTGVFFDHPDPDDVAAALSAIDAQEWDPSVLQNHAAGYSNAAFVDRIRQVVADVASSP